MDSDGGLFGFRISNFEIEEGMEIPSGTVIMHCHEKNNHLSDD